MGKQTVYCALCGTDFTARLACFNISVFYFIADSEILHRFKEDLRTSAKAKILRREQIRNFRLLLRYRIRFILNLEVLKIPTPSLQPIPSRFSERGHRLFISACKVKPMWKIMLLNYQSNVRTNYQKQVQLCITITSKVQNLKQYRGDNIKIRQPISKPKSISELRFPCETPFP